MCCINKYQSPQSYKWFSCFLYRWGDKYSEELKVAQISRTMITTWCGLIFFLGRESDDKLPLYYPETTEKSFNLNLLLRLLIEDVVREVTLPYYLIYSWVTLKYTLKVYKSVHRLHLRVSENCTNMDVAGGANESDMVGKWIWRPKHNLWSFSTFLQMDDRKWLSGWGQTYQWKIPLFAANRNRRKSCCVNMSIYSFP